jgi:hypothetical protein
MKRVRNTEANMEIGDEMNEVATSHTPRIQTEYHVQAVIKKKILFNKRPRPIIVSELKKIK